MQQLGDRAVRFPRPTVPSRALVRAIKAWPGVIDVVVARDDVAVYFDRAPIVQPARIAALATLHDDPEPPREIELRAIYDGEDASLFEDVARLHSAATYIVDMMGFSPGFAYMTGLDPRLVRPRRATPRPRVPAGSIAVAGGYTAVYPATSPGGWHLIGRVVDVVMFDASGPLLRLGDRVRFVVA